MQRGFFCLFLLLTACGRSSDSDPAPSERRLPYAAAPLDSLRPLEAVPQADTSAPDAGGVWVDSGWRNVRLDGLPGPGDLNYVRYTNTPYGYSIAYPDTLLSPDEPVGEDRGTTFVSASGDVRMIIYAAERAGYETLDEQYASVVEDPEVRITYRARDESFYVVSGLGGEYVFYEKAVAGESMITTFRIRYPVAKKAYYDAVAALIAASFRQ